jgi:asparagine synthase (glutamine-hydrolysing)
MCGIAGFCDLKNHSSATVLMKMMESLRHRGPDDSGYSLCYQQDAQIGLGHRRLSIIDLSPLGHQPMAFEDYEVILNGEIYNYKEIRDELQIQGCHFKSQSDTEVILLAFAKWGIKKMLEKFIGMFAFALFDKKNGKLYLVRDRVGVKPLYYYHQDDTFLFASELKAFHQHPQFKKNLNLSALNTYFQFGYSICPETIFQNTWQVKPGHYLEFDLSQKKIFETAYWKIENFYNDKLVVPETEILEQLEALMTSAFNYRLVADVPVGLFLSGGYDSSTVAALLQKDKTEKIRTFTIGFKEVQFDEAPHAKKVAAFLGTDHTEYYCSVDDALALIPDMSFYFDEPFADFSSIPTMLVSELARKKVTVALSADGGDELFGGYPKYLLALKYQKLRKLLPGAVTKPFTRLYDFASGNLLSHNKLIKYRTTSNKISELLAGQTAIDFARINVEQFEEKTLGKLLAANGGKRPSLFYNNDFFQSFDQLDQLLLLDFKVFLPDDLLVKIDRSTMRVSLEGREPLLDHRLIEFMGKVNAQSKLNYSRRTTKYFLKKIAHKYIPEELLNRPKMGFTPPLSTWLKGPLKEYIMHYLDKNRIESQGLLSYPVIERIKQDFYELNYSKASKKLWSLLVFQMWFEKWMH